MLQFVRLVQRQSREKVLVMLWFKTLFLVGKPDPMYTVWQAVDEKWLGCQRMMIHQSAEFLRSPIHSLLLSDHIGCPKKLFSYFQLNSFHLCSLAINNHVSSHHLQHFSSSRQRWTPLEEQRDIREYIFSLKTIQAQRYLITICSDLPKLAFAIAWYNSTEKLVSISRALI